MGVATRGVKFKFTSGEKVLCYEPDLTKAKVLYDSKVLDLVVNRDSRGRKVPEYLIHFLGWNSSWDRCVREEFILSFTDENLELQSNLAKEAALSLPPSFSKGKKRLPPLIKETLAKTLGEHTANNKLQKLEDVESPSDTDSSEEEMDVVIIIPDILKLQLEEDLHCITKKNKLVFLPCHPNVVNILEAFVKHSLSKMLCVSPPRNGKKKMPEDVQNKLSLIKEAVDGIRNYFDFTLPHLLLYPQEKQQHALNSTSNRSPQDFIKVEPQCDDQPSPLHHVTLNIKKEPEQEPNANEDGPVLNSQPEDVVKRKRGRPKLVDKRTLRSRFKSKSDPKVSKKLKVTKPKPEPTRILHPRLRTKAIPDTSPAPCSSPLVKHPGSSSSSSRRTSFLTKQSSPFSSLITDSSSFNTGPSFSLRPTSPSTSSPSLRVASPSSSLKRPSLSALVKKSGLLSPYSSSLRERPPSPLLPLPTKKKTRGRPPLLPTKEKTLLPTPLIIKEEKPLLPPPTHIIKEERPFYLPSPCSSTSGLFTPSCLPSPCPSSSGGEGSTGGEMGEEKKEQLLRETMEWRMLPASMYLLEPAAPSLVYGAQHLLRLFVALPDLISKMSISSRKLRPLLSILEQFLVYLCEQKDQLFPESAYVDCGK